MKKMLLIIGFMGLQIEALAGPQTHFMTCKHVDEEVAMPALETFDVFADKEQLNAFLQRTQASLQATALTAVESQPSLVPVEFSLSESGETEISVDFESGQTRFQLNGAVEVDQTQSSLPFHYAVARAETRFATIYPFDCQSHLKE